MERDTLAERPPYCCSANAYSVSPAPTTTCCRPSSRYVCGPLLVLVPRPACQRGLPVAASYATKLPPPSLPNSSPPAVLSRPIAPPLLPAGPIASGRDHLTCPVL